MAETGCRIDVWLWRARLCKTRAEAARLVEAGRVRVTRAGAEGRIDKPGRPVRIGDELVFAREGRLVCVAVAGFGERRGPPAEARALYAPAIDTGGAGLTNTAARSPGPVHSARAQR